MKITLSGTAGAGKGTVAALLSQELGWPVVAAGNFKRELARARGMNILDFDKKFTSQELDQLIDNHVKDFCKSHQDAIVDAWRGWFHVPDAVKIFLKCNFAVAAQRIWAAKRGAIEAGTTPQDIEQKIRERLQNNRQLMLTHDGADLLDLTNYDLVIDTTKITPTEVCAQILEFLER